MSKRIGILSSSRADYSIYVPLIKQLSSDTSLNVDIIAFGTHLSENHGRTISAIENDHLAPIVAANTGYALNDSPQAVAEAMGKTTQYFSNFWANNSYDLVFCLGDRYEMFAAVSAAVPFQIPMAHLYGGETTLGAIDECFRHSLTHMSHWHFAACEQYKHRLIELTHTPNRVFNLGHLSIDNLSSLPLFSIEELAQRTGVDFSIPTLLCTFHPETVNFTQNAYFAQEIAQAFEQLSGVQVLITMPNSDTGGMAIRKRFEQLQTDCAWVFCRENLGTIGYLSAMKHSALMIGNTSSGFVEASFFPKRVINLGDRQQGRIITDNILQTPIEHSIISQKIQDCLTQNTQFDHVKIYGEGKTAQQIHEVLKNLILI